MAAKFERKLKKVTAFLLTAVCLIASGFFLPQTAARVSAAEQINGHSLIAENDSYALYMNEEYLSIIVQDKATGAYMESAISYDDGKNNATWSAAMRSALVLTMIHGTTDTQQADLINDDVTKDVSYTSDGFSAKVYWNSYKFGMTLNVTLTEDGVVAEIPDESIVEDGEDYFIGTIAVYPYLGHSYLDDKEGYMFIPDGNGALIYLNDKEGRFQSGFTGMIYGSDPGFSRPSTSNLLWQEYLIVNSSNKIMAPVFGMAHTEEGIAYLAVVEKGAERANIMANPNGVNVDYNRIYARFTERVVYTQYTSNNSSSAYQTAETGRSHSDLQVHWIFLRNENANYCGMANAYRNYLMERGDLNKAEDLSYKTRVDFLGTDRESWVVGTSAVVMTTVEDIREIYSDLKEEGLTDLFTVYKGWQKGGLYNLPITSYKADSKIGGTGELTSLIQDAEEQGIEFYLYNDALRLNPDESGSVFNVVKQVNKRRYSESTYKEVYESLLYLIPSRSSTLLNQFVKSYTKKDVNRLALAGISNTLFSHYYDSVFYSRHETAQEYDGILSQISQQTDLVLEQPFAYLWKYTDTFLDMPLYTSNYMYEDESVPFMSIVLKGVMPVYSEYVNFEANKQEFFLKMVETGTYPSFYITKESSSALVNTNSSDVYSSQYEVYRSTMADYAEQLSQINQKVEGAYISGHEIRGNGITVVTYDNGVKIYLNYSSAAAEADGYTIEGMSVKVVDE
ncbi:MAG: DUF5696 domain-containing protein [bacterium]|nr:DUF5696 domain-containing protein [bacterium]